MQLCRQVVKTWFFTQVGPIPRSLGTGRPAALEPSYQRFEAPYTVIPLPLLAFSPPPSVMAPAKGKAKASSKKVMPPPAEPGTGAGGIKLKLNIRQSARRVRGAATEATEATEDMATLGRAESDDGGTENPENLDGSTIAII